MTENTSKSLPDQITDFFIALIFIGEIRPDDKLPPERTLAQHLDVDRTSLRSALRTLANMNIVRSVQGSGITVLDFQQHAKLNFAERICQIPELEIGSDWLWSAYEFKMTIMPTMIENAIKRKTSADLTELQTLLKEQLKNAEMGAGSQQLAEMEMRIQKHIASTSNNPFYVFHSNTMLNLHVMLMATLYDNIDAKKHLNSQLAIVENSLKSSESVELLVEKYTAFLEKSAKPLEAILAKRKRQSHLVSSPLHHKPKMTTLDI